MMNKKDELKSVSYKEAKNLRGGEKCIPYQQIL